MESADILASEASFWEFESPSGHQFSGCNVSQVDGLLWKQEAAGSKPATQTRVLQRRGAVVLTGLIRLVIGGSNPPAATHLKPT
jgi:hypothetical protein